MLKIIKKCQSYLMNICLVHLHLYRIATVKGTPPDAVGYSRFSYPCTFHVFITPDGRIIAEDYDLNAEQKEYVTNGSDVSFD